MAKIIAIANEKGGVGKTSATLNLGYALAEHGKRVLLVDLDGQANLTMLAGVNFPSRQTATVCELLIAAANEDAEVLERVQDYIIRVGKLSVITSKEKLADVANSLVGVTGREQILGELLAVAGHGYDYILIDCKPSVDVLTVNALTAADSIIIPTNADALSLKGVEALADHIAKVRKRINPRIRVEGILVTMLDGRTRNAREMLGILEEIGRGVNIYKTRIPFSVKMREAAMVSKSIFEHAPRSTAAEAYKALCDEFLINEAGGGNQ
jgi:chromosome partitioning protein